mgnify:FL=1
MYTCVNVGFVNKFNEQAETQLVTKDISTKAGKEEMQELLSSLSEEMDTDFGPNFKNVLYLDVVAMASSMEELEAMGY